MGPIGGGKLVFEAGCPWNIVEPPNPVETPVDSFIFIGGGGIMALDPLPPKLNLLGWSGGNGDSAELGG